MKQFLEVYEITGGDDEVLGAKLKSFGSKIKSELQMLGVIYKKATKGDNRMKWVYIGIKRKPEKDDEPGCQMELLGGI